MKNRNFADCCKNALGTVFLLVGAFFVCSTLLSMRSVLADPIAPMANSVPAPVATSARTNLTTRNSGNTVSRANATNTTTRAVASRAQQTNRARTVTTRAVASPSTSGAANRTTASRNVISRGTTTRATVPAARNVRSRVAATNRSRISLQGSAIRGSNAVSSTYTYLSGKLYTGNYSNIIDSTTGLISSDAYSNCLESYYTCMDEICTARNASQGRCSCAARARSFIQAEQQLETANEELIKVSGELALLIATKGKDVSSAFQLTDAEKIMNCASYSEILASGSDDEITDWCRAHPEYTGTGGNTSVTYCTASSAPTYCGTMGTTYGFNLSDLNGNGSDILASLKAWADAKDNVKKMLVKDNTNLLSAYTGVSDVVTGIFDSANGTDSTTLDSLANTWGYELFEYAHNNVCGRVLDSCFNGIYEWCGTPPSGGRCADGSSGSNCPFNFNSKITVSESGDVTLNERNNTTANASASCFGYSSSSGDPYQNLRGPVADARRSVMNKYLLDANAACDAYGEQLRTTAQNIGYQKVAAQQALQQKRLEFAQEEKDTILKDAIAAGSNFDNCTSEIIDCYETQAASNPSWSQSRVRTYCAQIANVPSCYETMICNPSNAPFKAVIDEPDSTKCNNSDDYTKNTCRNIVTLNDILNKAAAEGQECDINGQNCDSAAMREACLQKTTVAEIRVWKKLTGTCSDGYKWDAKQGMCVVDEE